eukprot:2939046-Prymnesium_polylepis.1
MSHLEFHVAVATAWCKTPKMVLEYEKPSPAEVRAAAAAAEPAQGGVRGERQRQAAAQREADEAAKAAADLMGMAQGGNEETPGQHALRRPQDGTAGPRSKKKQADGKSPPSGPGAGTPNMSDTKHEAAIASYKDDPAVHQIDFAKPNSNCQICGTGRGMRKPRERYQTAAAISCAHCRFNVCGPGCWKLLHGYYKFGEEPEEKPKEFKGGKGKAAASPVCEDADDEAEE